MAFQCHKLCLQDIANNQQTHCTVLHTDACTSSVALPVLCTPDYTMLAWYFCGVLLLFVVSALGRFFGRDCPVGSWEYCSVKTAIHYSRSVFAHWCHLYPDQHCGWRWYSSGHCWRASDISASAARDKLSQLFHGRPQQVEEYSSDHWSCPKTVDVCAGSLVPLERGTFNAWVMFFKVRTYN